MAIKSIVALFLGLLLQLSQVQAGLACLTTDDCAPMKSHTMSCCADQASCPCASNSEDEPKPAPIAPATAQLKLEFPAPVELDHEPGMLIASGLPVAPPSVPADLNVGYEGVPLSVAFCSYVI
ncbi:hypothetical protein JIN85_10170 [Luteolibacter pohnpeiensis]|uniref:Uncharacterized protein n=1 Tax=Luteolibacter pohnpeiensis TaxID=454153 RepID=A0A934S5U3_9BACT|nr:hypothetical protein [Luteolibacter pohnpeiensis]MBK1882782.1 hypothetical protein [Luteolibacter pohnpeiensis]